jgi:hypothetical protein
LKFLGLQALNDNPNASIIPAPVEKDFFKTDIKASLRDSNHKRLANPRADAMSLKWTAERL